MPMTLLVERSSVRGAQAVDGTVGLGSPENPAFGFQLAPEGSDQLALFGLESSQGNGGRGGLRGGAILMGEEDGGTDGLHAGRCFFPRVIDALILSERRRGIAGPEITKGDRAVVGKTLGMFVQELRGGFLRGGDVFPEEQVEIGLVVAGR